MVETKIEKCKKDLNEVAEASLVQIFVMIIKDQKQHKSKL